MVACGVARRPSCLVLVLAPLVESAFEAVYAEEEHPTVVLFYGDSSYKVLPRNSDCESWIYDQVLPHAVLVLPEILAIQLWCEVEDLLIEDESKNVPIEQVIHRRIGDGSAK